MNDVRENLKAYLDGELEPIEAARVREALERDEELRQVAREFRAIQGALQEEQAVEAIGLEQTLAALNKRGRQRARWRPGLTTVWVGAVAVLAVGFVIVVNLGSDGPSFGRQVSLNANTRGESASAAASPSSVPAAAKSVRTAAEFQGEVLKAPTLPSAQGSYFATSTLFVPSLAKALAEVKKIANSSSGAVLRTNSVSPNKMVAALRLPSPLAVSAIRSRLSTTGALLATGDQPPSSLGDLSKAGAELGARIEDARRRVSEGSPELWFQKEAERRLKLLMQDDDASRSTGPSTILRLTLIEPGQGVLAIDVDNVAKAQKQALDVVFAADGFYRAALSSAPDLAVGEVAVAKSKASSAIEKLLAFGRPVRYSPKIVGSEFILVLRKR